MNKIVSFILFLVFAIPLFSQNHDAEVLNHKTTIDVRDGNVYKKIYFDIQINNREGERFTDISIYESPLRKIKRIKAFIKNKNNKTLKKLRKRDITKKSAVSDYSFYEDDMVNEFTLKHNIYPYRLVYSYEVKLKQYLFVSHWVPVINKNIPTHKASLKLEIPRKYKISYKENNTDKAQIKAESNKYIYTWNASYEKIIDNEIFSPPIEDYLPKVIIVPDKYKFHKKGFLKNWVSYGNWQHELNKGLQKLPSGEKYKINTLIENKNTKRKILKTLYNFLQENTRYINITIETGGMKPYPAEYVAKNKYGDCKALSNYFKSILDYIDIDSYYTKINTKQPKRNIDTSFTSQQFNHVILCIPSKEDTIWLDCTSKGPFNYIGTSNQNRKALIIKKDSSHFVTTPKLRRKQLLETRKIKIKLDNNKAPVLNFTNVYRGENYEALLYVFNSFNKSKKKQIIKDHFIENGYEILSSNIEKINPDTACIKLNYTARSNNILKSYGNETLLQLPSFSVPEMKDPENRNLPVQIDCPLYRSDTIVFKLPFNFSVKKRLKNQRISNEFGEYTIDCIYNKNKVKIVKTFLLKRGEYPLRKYSGLYNFINEILSIENNNHILLTKK